MGGGNKAKGMTALEMERRKGRDHDISVKGRKEGESENDGDEALTIPMRQNSDAEEGQRERPVRTPLDNEQFRRSVRRTRYLEYRV